VYTRRLCRLEAPLDDVALWRGPAGRACLACYGVATGSALPMPKALRRDLTHALAAMGATGERGVAELPADRPTLRFSQRPRSAAEPRADWATGPDARIAAGLRTSTSFG